MGTNWSAGLIRWQPHVSGDGKTYSLNHLHPFRTDYKLVGRDKHPERTIHLHVAFSLHTFTRKSLTDCDPINDYGDNRERRTFDHARYKLSFELPEILRSLEKRACEFATSLSGRLNFVTVDLGQGVRYGVFFDLKRWLKKGSDAVLLVVESAYELAPDKPHPGKGRIGFSALLGHAIRGTRPKQPH